MIVNTFTVGNSSKGNNDNNANPGVTTRAIIQLLR